MSKLTAAQRRDLPASAFVFPKSRSYPVPDEEHAHYALQDVAQFGTPQEQTKVRAMVAKRYPKIDVSGGRGTPR